MNEDVILNKNMSYFTLYSLFSGKLFLATTQVLFFGFKGFSFAEIMIISSITEIVNLILELPSGIIADFIGNKKSMEIGMIFALISNVIAIYSNNIMTAMGYAVLCAVQESMLSGSDQAYLYNMLLEYKRENEYKEIIRSINSKKMSFIAVITILSGVLFKINPYMPFVVTTGFYLISFIMVRCLSENECVKKKNTQFKEYVVAVFEYLKSSRSIKWILLLNMCYTFLFMNQNVLLQQYLKDIKFPLILYGMVFFLLNLVSAYFSKIGKKLEKLLGEYTKPICTFVMAVCLIGAGILASMASLILLACCRACIAIITPIMATDINNSINDSGKRATLLSFYNAASAIPDSIISPCLGRYIDVAGIFPCYIVFGITGLIPFIVCLIADRCSVKKG